MTPSFNDVEPILSRSYLLNKIVKKGKNWLITEIDFPSKEFYLVYGKGEEIQFEGPYPDVRNLEVLNEKLIRSLNESR